MIKRTIALILCLTTLLPAAAGAQGFQEAAGTPAPTETTAAAVAPAQPDLNLPRATEEKILVAQTDTTAPAREREVRDSSCGSLRDWVDIHFGGHRWIYWVLAAGALVAIHVAH